MPHVGPGLDRSPDPLTRARSPPLLSSRGPDGAAAGRVPARRRRPPGAAQPEGAAAAEAARAGGRRPGAPRPAGARPLGGRASGRPGRGPGRAGEPRPEGGGRGQPRALRRRVRPEGRPVRPRRGRRAGAARRRRGSARATRRARARAPRRPSGWSRAGCWPTSPTRRGPRRRARRWTTQVALARQVAAQAAYLTGQAGRRRDPCERGARRPGRTTRCRCGG